jgi:DNA repair protein RecN (Recombination protein N)
MLKQLVITNIILIESIEISFGMGLNVLSGETGSGKSAIMNAFNLIIGGRADTGMIRRGSQKGSVEAIFDIDQEPLIQHLLNEAGINHDIGDDLIIRREINLNGKSRHFINNQATQGTCIRQIGAYLASIIGQHANQWLLSTDKHREIVDIYGELQEDLQIFSTSFTHENSLLKQLNDLLNNESKRFRDIEMHRAELEELQSANIKDGEDDEIFEEYSLLTQAENRCSKVNEILETLSGDRLSVIALLNKQKSNFDDLTEIDKTFAETSQSFKNALIEIQEISYSLRSYQSSIEYNPQRVQKLNERLTLITKLKKKYGNTVSEIREYQNQTMTKLESLENQDVLIEELKGELKTLESSNNTLAAKLTEKRKKVAKKFEKTMTEQLRSLNMPKVVFEIEFKPQKRNSKGDDHLEFYLIPNVGEHRIPIKASASGGELSRLLLAIQTLIAGKEKIPTLIFDEIDSNIGGETALIVGEKLKEIGEKHQVLCITHFPQVAKQAHHHFQISKKEENGRTFTNVICLDNENRSEEISRMMGGI